MKLDRAAELALTLPGVTEGERRGNRCWQVADRVFAWERPFTKADLRRFGDEPVPAGPNVALRCADMGETAAVLAEGRPGVFTIPHFDGYPAVLVDLSTTRVPVFRELVTDAWLATAPAALTEGFRT